MDIPTEPIGSIPRPLELIEAVAARGGTDPTLDPLYDEAVRDTNVASLVPSRAILCSLGNGSGLHQAFAILRTAFPGPRFPAPWAVANAVVRHGRQHRIDQRRAVFGPRRFQLGGERSHDLFGPLEAHLAWLDAVLCRGDGYHGADQIVGQDVRPHGMYNLAKRLLRVHQEVSAGSPCRLLAPPHHRPPPASQEPG